MRGVPLWGLVGILVLGVVRTARCSADDASRRPSGRICTAYREERLLTIIEAHGDLFSRTFAIPDFGDWTFSGYRPERSSAKLFM